MSANKKTNDETTAALGPRNVGKSRKTSGGTSVELVPQEHGGFLQKGNPGNRGPPTSKLRQRFRDSLESRFYIAEQIADDEGASTRDSPKIVHWPSLPENLV